MSDERRTISINPDLFQMTKKKRPASSRAPKIRPSGDNNNNNNKTVRRSAKVLKMIREQQEKNFRRLLENDVNVAGSVRDMANVDGDFQESLDYLMSLTEQEANKQQQQQQQQLNMNATLKNRIDSPALRGDPDFFNNENVSLVIPDDLMTMPQVTLRPPMPKWGCLKNGTLPSYRQYTQKNRLTAAVVAPPVNVAPVAVAKPFYTSPLFLPQNGVATLGQNSQGQVQDWTSPLSPLAEISQTMNAVTETTREPMILPRQQRTVRRTHYVGKNKTLSEVSVLVSNKTIRNRTLAKTHEIRQKPMEEVKRFLINKGFVRVGTSAPNDVLRKMYETAQLVCGEIQNHNPENLLFNFMNVGK